jgi:hypothetical protein
VARAEADGHTVLFEMSHALAIAPWLYPGLNCDAERNSALVCRVATLLLFLVAHP